MTFRTSEATDKIVPALIALYAECPQIGKDAKNPAFGGSPYATLEQVDKVLRPVLKTCDLMVMHTAHGQGDERYLCTRLWHVSGQWIENDTPLIMTAGNKVGPQVAMTGITYAKRYGLLSIVGAVAGGEDDDGNSAQGVGGRAADGSSVRQKGAKRMVAFEDESCVHCGHEIVRGEAIVRNLQNNNAVHEDCYKELMEKKG